MSRPAPPLNALRTLAAVVKYGGVSRAAEKLCLTHSAVSHQIRAIQEALDTPLFEKHGRMLRPTAPAAAYIARITAALDEVDRATEALLDARHDKKLRVSTTPSFAAHWLLPRLGDFIAANAGIDVELESSSRLSRLQDGEADVAIRFGAGHYPGLDAELLMRDWIFPVCAPDFARQHELAAPPVLKDLPRLHSQGEPRSWWLQDAGAGVITDPDRGIVFSDSSLMLQAAIRGQGIGLARLSVAYEALASGQLIRPYAHQTLTPHAYYFVCRKDKRNSPIVMNFRHWLGEQIDEFSQRYGTGAPSSAEVPPTKNAGWNETHP